MSRIYLDMDGVLADFDAGLRALGIEPDQSLNKSRSMMTPAESARKDEVYDAILAGPFFNRLPLMHDARDLWEFCAPHDPVILTAAPSRPEGFAKAAREKREWVEEHFGPIPDDRFVCTNSSKKRLFVGYLPGGHQILVDDRVSNVEQWAESGGTGVLHTSAANSILSLIDVLIERPGDSTHWWVKREFGFEFCERCGIVRRSDHGNRHCGGLVRVGLR